MSPSRPHRFALCALCLACTTDEGGAEGGFPAAATEVGVVTQSPSEDSVDSDSTGGEGQGSDSDGGDDNGGADGLDTSAPPPSPESCSLEATGLCYELPQGGGPEAWCDGLAAGHGDTAGWFAGLCEVGEALRCALPAGGPLEVAVDRLYYAPAFDPSSARADCLSAGGIAGE